MTKVPGWTRTILIPAEFVNTRFPGKPQELQEIVDRHSAAAATSILSAQKLDSFISSHPRAAGAPIFPEFSRLPGHASLLPVESYPKPLTRTLALPITEDRQGTTQSLTSVVGRAGLYRELSFICCASTECCHCLNF
jgi:hypothetical protein